MKKSILSLIFVLISTLIFSQELSVSINGSSYKQMTGLIPNSRAVVDTVFVENPLSIITISISGYNNGDLAKVYSTATGTTVINTFTCGTKDTIKLPAISKYYYVNYNDNGFYGYKFYIKVKNSIFNINSSSALNSVSFLIDSLYKYNYTVISNNNYDTSIVRGIYEYSIDQSVNTIPNITNTVTAKNTTLNYNYSTSGVYYLHLRAWNYNINNNQTKFGLKFTEWITYSISLTYVPSSVGIKENINTVSNLSAYPNPAQDQINITFNSNKVSENINIYNISGQLISTLNTETSLQNTVTIDLQNYISGIYVAQVGTSTYKFIKQ